MSSLAAATGDLDLREALVFRKQLIQPNDRPGRCAQRFPHARCNKLAQPVAEFPGLSRHFVQCVASTSFDSCCGGRFNNSSVLQPTDKVLAVADPIDDSTLR